MFNVRNHFRIFVYFFNKNDKQNIIPFRFDKATHVYVLLWWHFIVRDGVGQTVRQEEKDHYLNCTRAEWHFHFKYLLLLATAAFCEALHDGSRKKLWFHILREFSCVFPSVDCGTTQKFFHSSKWICRKCEKWECTIVSNKTDNEVSQLFESSPYQSRNHRLWKL